MFIHDRVERPSFIRTRITTRLPPFVRRRYGTNYTDGSFYLGLGKAAVAAAASDVLGSKLLCDGQLPCEPTWAAVERSVPPIRTSGAGGPSSPRNLRLKSLRRALLTS